MKLKTTRLCALLLAAALLAGPAFACNPAPADAGAALMGTVSPWYDDAQWNLDMLGAEAVFREGWLGRGVRVGVLDSGVDPHPAFADRLLLGRCFVEGADPADTADRYGHGTRIAGLIAGAGAGGCIGVAPAAELVPLKVTDGKTVKIADLCAAIYAGVDEFGCKVLNLSMGVRTDYDALREAVAYAEAQGVVVVAAVGNDGAAGVYYPAGYETVVGVGAVDRDGKLYYRSNTNESVFLTAPGADVRSTAAGGGYIDSSGTSFAVPQAAGAAAVLLGADPELTPAEIRSILRDTASDCGPAGYDESYGYGILNLAGCAAVLADKSEPLPYAPAARERPGDAAYCIRDDTCPMAAFADLDRGAWYHDGVHFALAQGVMNGVGDGVFDPAGTASRAMLVTMLWRMEGAPASDYAMTFEDVPAGKWYTEAVRWAAASHIVDGYSPAAFGPEDPVRREQLAVILWRYAGYRGLDTGAADAVALGMFPDAERISPWARDAVRWAVGAGLLNGVGNEKLSPETNAARAQVATMLMRFARI